MVVPVVPPPLGREEAARMGGVEVVPSCEIGFGTSIGSMGRVSGSMGRVLWESMVPWFRRMVRDSMHSGARRESRMEAGGIDAGMQALDPEVREARMRNWTTGPLRGRIRLILPGAAGRIRG